MKRLCMKCTGSGLDPNHKRSDGSQASCERCEGQGLLQDLQNDNHAAMPWWIYPLALVATAMLWLGFCLLAKAKYQPTTPLQTNTKSI